MKEVGLMYVWFWSLMTLCSCQPRYAFVQKETIKLSKPSLVYASPFFKEKIMVHPHALDEDFGIYYSIDNPQKIDLPLRDGLLIDKDCTLYTQCKGNGYIPSEVDAVRFVNIASAIPLEIGMSSQPAAAYQGDGASTLSDLQKGSENFRDGRWLGFDSGAVNLTIYKDESQHKGRLVFSFLRDHGAWIFHPASIDITYLYEEEPVGHETLTLSDQTLELPKDFVYAESSFPDIEFNKIFISIKALDQIPSWHPGAGAVPWVFIDELLWLGE